MVLQRAVRRIKEGTSAVLLQSVLDEKWWPGSVECYFHLRKFQDLLSDEKTPYERRFGVPFNGQVIPFGSMMEYLPISARGPSRQHQFGPKVLPGKFLGYAGESGKGMDASELHARRLNAKEVVTPQRSGNFIFPVADGTVKIFGRAQRLRTSTLSRERPERGEEQEILQGKSDEIHSPTPLQENSTRDDEET